VNPWIVTISVMMATFMELLDTTVVNVSIPHIAGNLLQYRKHTVEPARPDALPPTSQEAEVRAEEQYEAELVTG
jgi:hypothetical protein